MSDDAKGRKSEKKDHTAHAESAGAAGTPPAEPEATPPVESTATPGPGKHLTPPAPAPVPSPAAASTPALLAAPAHTAMLAPPPAPATASTGSTGMHPTYNPPPISCDETLQALDAEVQECGGNLRVKVWAYADCNGTGPFTVNDRLLADVEVLLTSSNASPESKRTAADGIAEWHDLTPGDYAVTATSLVNYGVPHLVPPAATTHNTSSPITITAGASVEVGLAFQPKPAIINGYAYYDAKRNGDPAGQARVNKVPIDFYCGEKLLHCVTTGHDSQNGDGFFSQQVCCHGSITISPRAQITAGGRTLTLPDHHPITVHTESNKSYWVPISYVEPLSNFEVIARLEREVPGQTGHNKERIPLPGVTFSLYRGLSASGDVIRSQTTSGAVPVRFSGLTSSEHTIVASGPTTYEGQQIELAHPPSGVRHHILGPGQEGHVVEFLYRPALGAVQGSVIDDRRNGLPGVTVTLTPMDPTQRPRTAVTDQQGQYYFHEVALQSYTVGIEREVVMSRGTEWEVPAAVQTGVPAVVTGSGTTPVAPFQLTPDVHKIIGSFTKLDGTPLAFLRVDIQNEAGLVVAQLQTDESGRYEHITPVAGNFFVVPHTPGGVPLTRFPAKVNSVKDMGSKALSLLGDPGPTAPPGSHGGMPPRDGEIRESVADLQSFPVLTEEVPAGGPATTPTSRTSSPGTMSGTSALGNLADRAIREVLSWRTKTDDPKGFVGALNQAFDLREVEGHTEFTWTPRSYTVQTDMGAVTGAQASIYTRAKVALDQSMPLLDGLYPLVPAVEAEDLATVQAVVRSQFSALVDEFGVVGGPRVSRVDEMFELLLGPGTPTNPERVSREFSLGLVRERFGLERRFVTTVDDEQNLTNYLILVDYVIGLKRSWDFDRSFFVRNGIKKEFTPFFGTQLVLISRALDVVAQGVQDAYFTMDSVFVTDAERQTAQLNFNGLTVTVPNADRVPEHHTFENESGLFIAELLDWVDRSASQELPALLQDAGKDGLESFRASTNRLRRLVHGALELSVRRNPKARELARGLPPGYHTPRVQRAILLLADGLDEAHRLAVQVKPPQLPTEVSANTLERIEKELRDIRTKFKI